MAESFSHSVNMCSFHSDAGPSPGLGTSDRAVNKTDWASLEASQSSFHREVCKGHDIDPCRWY